MFTQIVKKAQASVQAFFYGMFFLRNIDDLEKSILARYSSEYRSPKPFEIT